MRVATCPDRAELLRFLENQLSEDAADAIDGHIQECAACRSILDDAVAADFDVNFGSRRKNDPIFLRQLKSLDVAVITSSETGPKPDDRSTELPTIPNFEMLGELGRGGMGVVHHARHVALGREVAIKMLPAAAQLSEADRRRFKTEAETVARLQHPNIVQLFELGEVAGQPFLVFEYVDGGTLQDKLAGRPQPPRDAAALVEILARAVNAAHEQHIIHRDLKPANVLLADFPGSRYGFPKLTDFGLAKQLDAHSEGMTRSLSGTPAYMAPEQVTSGRPRSAAPFGIRATNRRPMTGWPGICNSIPRRRFATPQRLYWVAASRRRRRRRDHSLPGEAPAAM